MKQQKRHFYIMLDGKYVGETWAVSAAKARNNFWWKSVKLENEYSPRDYNPEDFDVVED